MNQILNLSDNFNLGGKFYIFLNSHVEKNKVPKEKKIIMELHYFYIKRVFKTVGFIF